MVKQMSKQVTDGAKPTLDALHAAIRKGNADEVGSLLAAGADVNGLASGDWRTALHSAAEIGREDIVTKLLAAGALVNTPGGTFGQYPLHLAVAYRHVTVARVLVNAGADISIGDAEGSTPLHTVVVHGSGSDVKCFIELRANVNIGDKFDRTPLHLAALHDKIAAVTELLKVPEIELDWVNSEGETAYEITGSEELRALISQARIEQRSFRGERGGFLRACQAITMGVAEVAPHSSGGAGAGAVESGAVDAGGGGGSGEAGAAGRWVRLLEERSAGAKPDRHPG